MAETEITVSSEVSTGYHAMLDVIGASEPRIARAIGDELANQRRQLKLIASENYASPAVLMAMGTWLSDKYAEGTIGHRFYAGCEVVDEVESIAAEHARALFGAEHAYVQPHSGIDANLVAYWSILAKRVERPFLDEAGAKNVDALDPDAWAQLRAQFGAQRMMGMSLDAGGHLTHGFRANISGKMFDQASYGTDPETGLLDYDAIAAQAREFRPLILVAGYSAYPRNPDFARLAEIAAEVGRHVHGGHGPLRRAGGRGRAAPATSTRSRTPTWSPAPRTSPCAARAAAWCCAPRSTPRSWTAAARWSWVARSAHVIAAKAVALAEARQPAFADYAAQIVDQRPRAGRGPGPPGRRPWSPAAPTTTWSWPTSAASYGLTGRQAESALLEAGVVTNRNSMPARPQRRLVHLRHPPRHPRPDHPGPGPGRPGRGGRHHGHRPVRHHPAGRLQGQAPARHLRRRSLPRPLRRPAGPPPPLPRDPALVLGPDKLIQPRHRLPPRHRQIVAAGQSPADAELVQRLAAQPEYVR